MFILCGIADEPTWPGRNPSVASSAPAINRMVMASDDGPAASCTSADSTSWSSDRGYTCPTDVSTASVPDTSRTTLRSSVIKASAEPSRSSMSWPVPTGPLIPRIG